MFNYAAYVLSNDKTNNNAYSTMIFPIIRRIFVKIEITNDIVEKIINEVKEQYQEIDFESYIDNDPEVEFVCKYSENKINELKNNTQQFTDPILAGDYLRKIGKYEDFWFPVHAIDIIKYANDIKNKERKKLKKK